MEIIIFLILSFLTGLLELGVVWASAQAGSGLVLALVYVLGYQLGNLCFYRSKGYVSRAYVMGIIGMLNITILRFCSISKNLSIILFAISIFSGSLILQTARSKMKGKCSTSLKRFFRIIGFTVSPIMMNHSKLILFMIIILSIAILNSQGKVKDKEYTKDRNVIVWAMVFHQMHYFTYTYVLIWIIKELVMRKMEEHSIAITSVVFALTWIVYLLPEAISRHKKKNDYVIHFFLGHCFLLLIMVGMVLTSIGREYITMLVLWGFTGLGGGTVYTISRLTNKHKNTNMKFSEDIGHVMGVVIAIITVIDVKSLLMEMSICLSLSASFVAITIILMFFEIKKVRK